MGANTFIGVLLAMTASTMNATGMNLQRFGQRAQLNGDKKDRRMGRRINAAGVFLSTACGLVDFISFGFAPQTTLAPFGSMSLVVNLVLAPLLHGEELHRMDFLSTAFVMSGLVVCILSNRSPALELADLGELKALLTRPICFVYAALAISFIFGSLWHVYIEEKRGHGNRKSVGAFYPVVAGE